MRTYSSTNNSMITCVDNTGDYVQKSDIEELVIISARLAESLLMDWDREEQLQFAKDIACITHNLIMEE